MYMTDDDACATYKGSIVGVVFVLVSLHGQNHKSGARSESEDRA